MPNDKLESILENIRKPEIKNLKQQEDELIEEITQLLKKVQNIAKYINAENKRMSADIQYNAPSIKIDPATGNEADPLRDSYKEYYRTNEDITKKTTELKNIQEEIKKTREVITKENKNN